MLSKEEISKLKINVFNQCDDETIRLVAEMLKHTEQLESDKQKLIEKLEKKIRYYEENDEILATSNDNYSDGTVIKKFIDKFREILSILKGENQVTVK